jgi:hypothetical protein
MVSFPSPSKKANTEAARQSIIPFATPDRIRIAITRQNVGFGIFIRHPAFDQLNEYWRKVVVYSAHDSNAIQAILVVLRPLKSIYFVGCNVVS